ncbi:MAG: hypothetical protein WD648_00735 [Planctomycetaceae bacterium]
MKSHSAGRNPRISIGLRLLAVMALTIPTTGCLNYLIAAAYFIGGPPSIEPVFDKETKKSMTDKGVTVAVVCFAPDEVKFTFDNIDKELGKYVSFRLHGKNIKVFSPDVVNKWLDEHNDWDKPEQIGAALDATYVVFIDLHTYTLFAENSVNLYQGRAECLVSVFEMNKDDSADRIFSKEINSKYPLAVPRQTSETTYSTFKRQYLSRFSEEIGRLFYEYYNDEDIDHAT